MKEIRAKDRSGEMRTFRVGDYVDLKSDYEQSGKIVKIEDTSSYLDRSPVIHLRYTTDTVMRCDDVWAKED